MEDTKNIDGQEIKLTRIKNRLETNNTLILAIATLAITWCSYQCTLWNGIQTFKLAESSKWNRLAQEKNLMTVQHQAMDESVIISFVQDVLDNREDKIRFYMSRLRPEMQIVLKAWVASQPLKNPNAPLHPMVTKEYQQLLKKSFSEANNYLKKAEYYYSQAEKANTYSDRYSLFTVVFSMIMFMGAIATKLTQLRLSFTLVIISGLICLAILVTLFLVMPLARE